MIKNQLSISKRVYQIPLIVQFSFDETENFTSKFVRSLNFPLMPVEDSARSRQRKSEYIVLGESYFTRVYVETRGRSVGPLSRRRELTGRLTCELLRANYCNRNGRKHSTRRLMDQYVSRMSSFVYGPPFTIIYLKIR